MNIDRQKVCGAWIAGVLLGLQACGTADTRNGESAFGAYPLQAVAHDVYLIAKTFGRGEEMLGTKVSGPFFLLSGMVSLPFDLFCDLLVLPVDIGVWIAGRRKTIHYPWR